MDFWLLHPEPHCRGRRVPAADAKMSQVRRRFRTRIFHSVLPNVTMRAPQEAMNETFLLSNIAPQVGEGFNRHCALSFSLAMSYHLIFPSHQTGHTWRTGVGA